MFGYIGVCRDELKVKEFETFRAYYCGLCRALKREYSEKARLLLNYDCAFLYLLCEAQSEDKPVYETKHCMVHPVRKRHMTDGRGAEYAAAVNVLLGVNSLRDHAGDDKNIAAALAAGIYRADCEKAARRYPEAAKATDEGLKKLAALEKSGESDIDRAADAFAGILSAIFSETGGDRRVLSSLGYNMGRWIYLIDAYDDFEKDVKKGSYNPFIKRFGETMNEEIRASAEFNLNACVSGAAAALDLLDIKKHEGILKNIIYLGMYEKTSFVLNRERENHKDERSV